MNADIKRIALSEKERKLPGYAGIRAIEFRNTPDGIVIVECWDDFHETYGDSAAVSVPYRVWRLAIGWLTAHVEFYGGSLRPLPGDREESGSEKLDIQP